MRRSPFALFDSDGDGKITKDEVLKLFATVDKNNDGAVTRDEFIGAIMSGAGMRSAADEKTADRNPRHDRRDGDRPAGDGPRSDGTRRMGREGRGPGPGHPNSHGFGHRPSAEELLAHFDKEHKGSLKKDDVPEPVWNRISKADTNNDGTVTKDELEAHMKAMRDQRPRPDAKPAAEDKPKSEAPAESKPQEPKADDKKPSAQRTDAEFPADATNPSNVGD